MDTIEVLDLITGGFGEWRLTGSREICVPAPKDTDVDYVAYVVGEVGLSEAVHQLAAAGFNADMGEHYQDLMEYGFISWKRGEDNIILTKNREFFEKHVVATKVCKKLNLLNKADRVMVFQAVLYANYQAALLAQRESGGV